MKPKLNLYNYPFQKVQDFLDTDIDKRLDDFYKSIQNEFIGHRIKLIDQEKNEVKIYKDSYEVGELEYSTHSFEKEIKYYFVNLIYKSFDVIAEGINICFVSKQSVYSYFDKLERQFKKLKKHDRLNQYPFLKEYLKYIENELNNYKNIDAVKAENEIHKDDPFQPLIFLRSFYHKLYDIAILCNLINIHFPREDFVDVFLQPKTLKKITFTCNNPKMVSFFESIKSCFDNLNAKSIGDSKRFYSKQENLFSTSNYESTHSRMKTNKKIIELQEELNLLISQYK